MERNFKFLTSIYLISIPPLLLLTYSISVSLRAFNYSSAQKNCFVLTCNTAFRFPPVPHPLANKESARIKQEKHTATCVQPLEVMIQARKVNLCLGFLCIKFSY